MSIETDLKRLADAAEIIAAHLTAKVGVQEEPLALPVGGKRGRPAKVAKEEAEPLPAPTLEDAPTPAPKAAATEKISEQALREELRQYIVRHETKGKGEGMKAAQVLLVKYNAKTVSTIKPENYAAIVQECREDKAKYEAAASKK